MRHSLGEIFLRVLVHLDTDFFSSIMFELRFTKCGRCEGVQGVLTLFCSGAAQVVCHALRVEELREQLEVEEEDGDRQEEEEEVESGEGESRRVRHGCPCRWV